MKKAALLTNSLDMRHYDDDLVAFMSAATRCLNCGARLNYSDNKDKRRNRGYCSLRCYYEKPPKLAYAEAQWGMPARELLLELLNRNTVTATAGLLGVGKPNLYNYIRKFGIRKKVVWE